MRTHALTTSLAGLALLVAGCANGPTDAGRPASGDAAQAPALPLPTPAPLSASSIGRSAAVPARVRTPLNQSNFLLVSGSGVQIYECAARPGAAGVFEWTLRGPEATLKDASGTVVGKHYAGPTWEANDGSKVVGTLVASDPGPDASAIPWLLLTVQSTSGSGILTQTRSIQRLQTIGGMAPAASGCGDGAVGRQQRVPYAATYAFFRQGS